MGGGKGGGGSSGSFSGGGHSIIQVPVTDASMLPETAPVSQGMGSAMTGQLASAAAAGQNSSTLGQQLGNQMGNYGSVQMPQMNLAQMFANAQGFNPFSSSMMSNGNPFGSPIQFGMGAGMYGAPMSQNPGAPAPAPPPPTQGGGGQQQGGNWHGHRGAG